MKPRRVRKLTPPMYAVLQSGRAAASTGKPRVPPYGADTDQGLMFRRLWLRGYDAALRPSPQLQRDSTP